MKSVIIKGINYIFLVVIFQVFRNTPLYDIDKYLSILCLFISLFYLTQSFFLYRDVFHIFSRRWIFIFLSLLVFSIIAGFLAFKQSMLDTLIASQTVLQIIMLAFYAYIFRKEKIDFQKFETFFKIFIFVNIIILLLFAGYKSTSISSFTGQELKFKSEFLPKNFIRLGVFFYFVLFLRTGKYVNGLICLFLVFFPNLLIDFQRGYFAITILLLITTAIFLKKSDKGAYALIFSGCILIIAIIISLTFSDSIVETIVGNYSKTVQGIISGQSDDASINYRFVEIEKGTQLFNKNHLIGTGKLRSDDVVNKLGVDFYPTDIGILGILSTYGLIGLAVFISMFYVSIREFFKILRNAKKHSVFVISLSVYSMYLILESFQTANVMFYPVYWGFLYLLSKYGQKYELDDQPQLLA